MCSRPFRPFGFAHLCRSRPRGSVHSLVRLQLYVGHSHCPRACASYPSCVAVYPRDSRIATCSMSLIPSAPLKLVRCPHLLIASLETLPCMSLSPFPPFSFSQPTRLPLQR